MGHYSRQDFLKTSAYLTSGIILEKFLAGKLFAADSDNVTLSGHLWVFASEFPPHWDCTPILDQVFRNLSNAGIQGVEVMDVNMRHDDAVPNMKNLIQKYNLPVTGSSYGADMWDKSKHQEIIEDVKLIAERLQKLGASTFGISVGNAGHVKTESELDVQADALKQVFKICKNHHLQPNLHNHTYEVNNDMHDLRGTLKRIPDAKLGPDLGWLKRAGVDPVQFIKKYGDNMVYMHIRDLNAQNKWTKVVGEGIMDWQAISKELRQIGFDQRAAIELAFQKAPPRGKNITKYWGQSRDYVQKIFGW